MRPSSMVLKTLTQPPSRPPAPLPSPQRPLPQDIASLSMFYQFQTPLNVTLACCYLHNGIESGREG